MDQRVYLPIVPRNSDGLLAPFGVEVWPWRVEDADADLAQMAQLGSRWARVNSLKWRVVQPEFAGEYRWGEFDPLIKKISDSGFRTIVVLSENPEWARVDTTTVSGTIKDEVLDEFVAFVGAAVERYSRHPYNVKYWELFNEPDGTPGRYGGGHIGAWGNDGDKYAEMLKRVYPAIKQVDPEAKVVLGGLAYSWFIENGGPFNRAFLDDVLTNGGGDYFDIFNFHYYSVQATEWQADGIDIIGKTNYLRRKLSDYGYATKPMICTEVAEFGDPSNSEALEKQARYVAKVYSRGLAAGLEMVMWYSLHAGASYHYSGLMHEVTRKPAWHAYQTMTSVLAEARFGRTLTPQDVGLPADAPFEGYAFRVPGSNRQIWVVWMNAGSANISVRGASVHRTDKFGQRTLLQGQGGRVTLPLNGSPLYLELS